MRKYTGPSFTKISKAIRKVKTIKQLDKVQVMVVEYDGKYIFSKRLYKQYNTKNDQIRFPKTQ